MLALVSVCGLRTAAADDYWIEPMRRVHARFTGTNGTLGHFGDSITVTIRYQSTIRVLLLPLTREVVVTKTTRKLGM